MEESANEGLQRLGIRAGGWGQRGGAVEYVRTYHVFYCQDSFIGGTGGVNNSIAAYASTVDEGDVCVVECTDGVCEEVSEIGLLAADDGRSAVERNPAVEKWVLHRFRDAVVDGG